MANEPTHRLIRHTTETYGESFKAHLLEQYVESAEKVSERRVSANNYLLTVNAFLVTLYGLLAGSPYKSSWTVLVPIAGILVSLTWYRIITSYRDLNTVKFQVIHELEQEMPAALYAYLRVLPHISTPAILSKTRLRMRLWTKRIRFTRATRPQKDRASIR
jgi:L-asparagine transporter-like permease